jgi:hypothetical protein
MKTNSKFKLSVLVLAVALFPLFASEKASAQNSTGFLTQTGTGLTTFTINLGQTFSLDLNILNTFNSVGITYFYQTGANGSSLFSIISRSNGANNVYADNTTADGQVFLPANALLDPVTGTPAQPSDLGATCNTCPVAPGTYFMSTFTFSTTAGIGTYTIFLDSRGSVADSDFNDHILNANTITINVVPEPATTGLAVLGGVMLLAFVWKARRVMA